MAYHSVGNSFSAGYKDLNMSGPWWAWELYMDIQWRYDECYEFD